MEKINLSQPLVSIVIPIYNAENFLEKCIRSILKQTYRKLQIILVNDGSTDDSLEICKRYAEVDVRIHVINQENSGVASARKAGVVAATGAFIGWVDADDWIESDYFEQLIRLQCESNADIVAVAHYHDIGNDSMQVRNGIPNGIYRRSQIVDRMLYTGEFFEYGITPQLYTKLFKADILKETQAAVAEEIVAGDDAAVVYPSLLKANCICVSDIAGYHYVQHLDSITKTTYSNEYGRVKLLIDFLKEVFRDNNLYDLAERQLEAYKNYMLSLRQIDVFDEKKKAFLSPYGGLAAGERVVIYGAGVLGQKIHKYIETEGKIIIVDWLDKNYIAYQNNGLEVHSPDILRDLEGTYDYVIIANITEKVARKIKEFLMERGVAEKKILWFSSEFRQSNRKF